MLKDHIRSYPNWRHQVVNNICSKTEVKSTFSIICIDHDHFLSNILIYSLAIVSITKVSQYNKSHLVSIKHITRHFRFCRATYTINYTFMTYTNINF